MITQRSGRWLGYLSRSYSYIAMARLVTSIGYWRGVMELEAIAETKTSPIEVGCSERSRGT